MTPQELLSQIPDGYYALVKDKESERLFGVSTNGGAVLMTHTTEPFGAAFQ